jgi:hypothetical protein
MLLAEDNQEKLQQSHNTKESRYLITDDFSLIVINVEKALEIVNELLKEKLFKKYAIGGGIAAIFYIEPITTFDLDIFILIKQKTKLLTLTPIYEWLMKRNYIYNKEQIIIEGIPVQFIPAYNILIEEAVHNATKIQYKGIETFILTPEYLFAIMLQTNRPKDKDRMITFMQQADMSFDVLTSIVSKHSLLTSFEDFKRKYMR